MQRAPVRLRMGVAALGLVGLFVSAYLALNEMGLTGLAACTPGGGCDTVQSSAYSSLLGVPVAFLGVGGYGALFAVAFLGTRPRLLQARWVALSLPAMGIVAFLFSAYLTAVEAWVIHAWCLYCVASAVIATLIFLLSLGELAGLRAGNRLKDESEAHG